METFYNAAVVWFIIGFVLFLLEFVVPGLILFFFAIGAWVVGILSLFIDLSINLQLLIFIATSILTILLLRKSLKKVMWNRKSYSSTLEDEFIGKSGDAETFIGPGRNGKIYFKGTSWDARSQDTIEPGEKVIIIGNDSIVLIIKSTKSLL